MPGPCLTRLCKFAFVICLGLLSACASPTFNYTSKGPANLTIGPERITTQRYRKRFANVAIYSETEHCVFKYAGSITLGKSVQKVGLATARRVMLQFNFGDAGGFFSNYSSLSSFERILVVRRGSQYRVDLAFIEDATELTFRQNGRKRTLPTYDDVCKP